MSGNFSKVVRLKSKLRMALMGVSGSGKTLGALYIAYGLTEDWGKIALIDTEHERARLYANREDLGTGEFLYAPLAPPYSADRYKNLVQEAAGIVGEDGVVIIDSFSHAWENEGGVKDVAEKISAQSRSKNTFAAWNEAGRIQNSLINTVLSVGCHTIVTMRSKMEYTLETNERGKQVPIKVGLKPIQRDNTEYEFDIVLDIGRDHIATAGKDVTFLDNYGEVITPRLGEDLREWLQDGVDPKEFRKNEPLSKVQINEVFEASGKNKDICVAAYQAFGYKDAKEILQRDYEAITAKAEELLQERENQAEEEEEDKDSE